MDVSPDRLPARIEKPWGYEIWYAWTDRYVGKILHVRRGHRLSLQYHREKDEASYVLRGRLLLTKGPSPDQLTSTEIGETGAAIVLGKPFFSSRVYPHANCARHGWKEASNESCIAPI